jgi:hypothetical protein
LLDRGQVLAAGLGLGDAVGVGEGVAVGTTVGVGDGVAVGAGVGVAVAVGAGVGVAVAVGVGVGGVMRPGGVAIAVGVGAAVGVALPGQFITTTVTRPVRPSASCSVTVVEPRPTAVTSNWNSRWPSLVRRVSPSRAASGTTVTTFGSADSAETTRSPSLTPLRTALEPRQTL